MTPSRLEKIVIAIIYILPALLLAMAVAIKVFPEERFVHIDRELDESTLVLRQDNSFIVTPTIKSKAITLKVASIEKSAPGENIIVKKGHASSFYPVNPSLTPPRYIVKSYKGKNYLVGEKEKKLIPTENILRSYQSGSSASAMTDEEFSSLALSHDLAGFMDGTLIQYKDSIFVISEGKKYVITSPQVFTSLGYDWNSVLPASVGEARIHPNGDFPLLINSLHPDGTILMRDNPQAYYLVYRGERIQLTPEKYSSEFQTITPVKIPREEMQIEKICALNEDGQCTLGFDEAFLSQPGTSCFFQLPGDLKVKEIDVIFHRSMSLESLRDQARTLINK